MTAKEFDKALLAFLRREPFQPFTVVFDNGERFVVEEPHVVHGGDAGGGDAAYIDANDHVHFFGSHNVAELIPAATEAIS
jgi:hypothetical protein